MTDLAATVAELERLYRAANVTAWEHDDGDEGEHIRFILQGEETIATVEGYERAELIERAVSSLPALLAAVKRGAEDCARYREELAAQGQVERATDRELARLRAIEAAARRELRKAEYAHPAHLPDLRAALAVPVSQ